MVVVGKEPGSRGEAEKPRKICFEGAAAYRTMTSNKDAATVALLLLMAPEVESRTCLIYYHNMASVGASSHQCPTGTPYHSKAGPLYSCHHLLWGLSIQFWFVLLSSSYL